MSLPDYLLIADDLTGACDAGVAFAKAGIPITVALNANGLSDVKADTPMLAVNTASRNLEPLEAFPMLESIYFAYNASPGCKLVFKKIDSTLRGNVSPEIKLLSEFLNFPLTFLAPAAPLSGRVVKDGILLIDGIPLHQTEFAKDPLAPVTDSFVANLFESPTYVKLIDLKTVRKGVKAIIEIAETMQKKGVRVLVFDAESQADLDAIAKAGLALETRPMFAGSSGLAASLAPLLKGQSFPPKITPSQPIFFICGSAHKMTHLQIEVLADTGVPVFHMPTEFENNEDKEKFSREVVAALRKGSVVLASPLKRLKNSKAAKKISRQLASLALKALADLGSTVRPTLFLTGGETAYDVLSAFTKQMRLLEELAPGIVSAAVHTDGHGEIIVITKAGGFGNSHTMADLLKKCE